MSLDAPKSDLERFKMRKQTSNMSKKRPTNAQEAAKNAKKTPKNEKCANIAPTYPRTPLGLGTPGPPLGSKIRYIRLD